MNEGSRRWSGGTALCFVPSVVVAVLVVATLRHRPWNELFFVHSTYYIVATMVGAYVLVRLGALREGPPLRAWLLDNAPGIVTTAIVSAIVVCGVPASYRVLADEANLVAVSKNLYLFKTADFAVTGKWYFENYWNISIVTDRRPTLFPFLVSLLHVVRGYHAENAFHVNAMIFVAFVFLAYRFAKSLGGEVFGVASAIFVASSPNTLVSARSAGFDLLSVLLLLMVIKAFYDYAIDPAPRPLATLVLSLCLLAHVRVEGLALFAAGAAALAALRIFRFWHLRGYGFVHALVPVFLVSRYWQSIAKAHDAEQPISASLFARAEFAHNVRDYFGLLASPLEFDGPHARLVMIVAGAGIVVAAVQLVQRARAGAFDRHHAQLALFGAALLGVEVLVCFSYMWGRPSQPASSRLFIWLDTFSAFMAAWFVTVVAVKIARWREADSRSALAVGVLASGAFFAMYMPIASDARFVNALLLTRQAAGVWRFFERLGEERILVLSDRPGLFTIMNYGALDLSTAVADRNCLYELSRHLYKDIYLVQEMDLTTKQPRPGFAAWPDVPTQSVYEFQNTDSDYIRIARVVPTP